MENIIIIGRPNSGKTHYFGQLYGRISDGEACLKLNPKHQLPKDISLLEDVLTKLANGKTAGHTPTDTWGKISLPVIDENGNEYLISLPDYAGEQITQIFSSRSLKEHWIDSLNQSKHWVVLIRLNSEKTFFNDRGLMKDSKQNNESGTIEEWDANAFWIEIFQILLYYSGIGLKNKVSIPKLTILLSCYDEIEKENTTPEQALEEKLPLFYKFLQSNWQSTSINIWGLSSLGCTLGTPEHEDEFINLGPEKHGWVVAPHTFEHQSDLTLPIYWLINK
ncbi:hypothetical protein GCM10010099_23550 [Streptomyces cinereus]|nr:hypothetical protein GCM10010099_23550 [Streptomyces cinereus]